MLQKNCNNVQGCYNQLQQIEIEIEIDKEIDIDIELKKILLLKKKQRYSILMIKNINLLTIYLNKYQKG